MMGTAPLAVPTILG